MSSGTDMMFSSAGAASAPIRENAAPSTTEMANAARMEPHSLCSSEAPKQRDTTMVAPADRPDMKFRGNLNRV